MKKRRFPFEWLMVVLLSAPTWVSAQEVYLSLFRSGNAVSANDVLHRVELFNPSPALSRDLGGWYLVTRRYALRIPDRTVVGPLRSVSFGRPSGGASVSVDLSAQRAILARSGNRTEGDYLVLVNPNLEIEDAFFFAQSRKPEFLPARVDLPSSNGQALFVMLPDGTDPKWGYQNAPNDPAISYARVGGKWMGHSQNKNLNPAVEYDQIQTVYSEGIVTFSWKSNVENDCYFHLVERSTDDREYVLLQQVAGKITSQSVQAYHFYDPNVVPKRVYYYRVRNIDKFGQVIATEPIKVRTEEGQGNFFIDVVKTDPQSGTNLSIRFSSGLDQYVRVNLLDEELREIAVLFDGEVEVDREHLVKLNKTLPIGKYYLVASTASRKYYEPFILE